jgi:hypothetical protein
MTECERHGVQEEAFVCGHLAQSLVSGFPVGFFWPASATEPRPDAWCSGCEERRVAAGGSWTPEAAAALKVRLVCGACYDLAKDLNRAAN